MSASVAGEATWFAAATAEVPRPISKGRVGSKHFVHLIEKRHQAFKQGTLPEPL
jgi:hypothetical protein